MIEARHVCQEQDDDEHHQKHRADDGHHDLVHGLADEHRRVILVHVGDAGREVFDNSAMVVRIARPVASSFEPGRR